MANPLYTGTFNLIRSVEFQALEKQQIDKIHVQHDSKSAFFYPIYYFVDDRCCWGRYILFWSKGSLNFQDMLNDIESKFRTGSSISIFFSLGVAILLKDKGGKNYCIKFEREEYKNGIGTTIADANNDFKSLRNLFDFFRKNQTTRKCIDWAKKNSISIGRWHNSTLILNNEQQKIYRANFRNFSNSEIAFIGNKLNHREFCCRMIQRYYYSSHAFWLRGLGKNNSKGSNTLKINRDIILTNTRMKDFYSSPW